MRQHFRGESAVQKVDDGPCPKRADFVHAFMTQMTLICAVGSIMTSLAFFDQDHIHSFGLHRHQQAMCRPTAVSAWGLRTNWAADMTCNKEGVLEWWNKNVYYGVSPITK